MMTRTTPMRDPRALLANENMDGRAFGQDQLLLPPGYSRYWCSHHILGINPQEVV